MSRFRAERIFLQVTTAAERISSIIQFTREYEKICVNAQVRQDCGSFVDTAVKGVRPGEVMRENDLPARDEMFADRLIVKSFTT